MDPILKIIYYLFKKHNKTITDETLDSFFNNGMSFPQFIEIIFNETLPGIIKDPVDENQKKSNNDIALQYLFTNNEEIAKISPTFNTEKDQKKLLSLIISKECFKINEEEIKDKCNQILDATSIFYMNTYAMINTSCLLFLLNVLTDGKVDVSTNSDDIDEILIQKFKEANAPLVIDKTAFEDDNQLTFFIQIQILLDFFSDKNDDDIESQSLNETVSETENSIKDESPLLFDEGFLADNLDDLDSLSDSEELVDDFQREKLSDRSLFIAIKSIGSSKKIKFESLSKSVEINKMIDFSSIFFDKTIMRCLKPWTF